ncbi:MAG: hypothetical protein MJA32_04000 [Proteobacteria bacterium]|nr:hypothetical protein [Pseudomonadota bacterium]
MKINKLIYALTIVSALAVTAGCAASAPALNNEVDHALAVVRDQVDGADVFLDQAAGYLVFPRVIKAGVMIGGETGEGALRVGGSTVAYYRTTSGSIGFQYGAQSKSILVAFMTREALDRFRNSKGWRVGVDGSVALIDIGAGKTIDTDNIRDPVVGFIYGSKGLMANLTLEGTKFTRLNKS